MLNYFWLFETGSLLIVLLLRYASLIPVFQFNLRGRLKKDRPFTMENTLDQAVLFIPPDFKHDTIQVCEGQPLLSDDGVLQVESDIRCFTSLFGFLTDSLRKKNVFLPQVTLQILKSVPQNSSFQIYCSKTFQNEMENTLQPLETMTNVSSHRHDFANTTWIVWE